MAVQAERRAVPRTATKLPVTIVHHDGVERDNGDVKNVSPMGAKVAVSSADYLPERFYMLLPDHRMEACTVVWRNDGEMGVVFASAAE